MQTAFLIFVLVVIGGYYTYAKIIPFFRGKQLKGAKKGERIHYQAHTTLSPDQCRQLALAAIYHVYQPSYLNTLETGIEKAAIEESLISWWGISTPEEAAETLVYLRDKGFRFYFPGVWRAYHAATEAEKKGIILSGFNSREDRQKALSHVENLTETIPVLKAKGIIDSEEDVANISINAWDYGRIIFLARLCYEAGYLTEKEVWHFINTGDELSQQEFSDWATFGKSYVLGRAMWGGNARGNDETIEIYEYLMADPKSPWVKLPWRQHAQVKF